jgi:hypothetical protein
MTSKRAAVLKLFSWAPYWASKVRFIKGQAEIIIPNHGFGYYEHYADGIVG